MKTPIRQLPSPFGANDMVPTGLIAQRIQETAVEDLALQDSYPPTPQFESVVKDAEQGLMFVLVRVGSKYSTEAVLTLVRYMDALMDAGRFEVSEHAAAFLFDADDEGVSATVSAFQRNYAPYYGDLGSVAPAQWTSTRSTPVGLYVFHADDKETGTLEHHVAPMVESAWPERYAAARCYIDENRRPADAVSKSDAKRLKAVITSAGQFDHPSRPLGTILAKSGLPDERYRSSEAANALASFLMSTPWQSADNETEAAATSTTQETR